MSLLNLFATTPKGLELLLVDELRELGATDVREKLAGVMFKGDLRIAYQACLWSRLANRILLRLSEVPAATPEELYAGVQSIQWAEHLNPSGTFIVNFSTSQSNITHSLFGAQKVKDAIVDQLRATFNVRPNIERDHPDINVNVYLYRNRATISLDLSGESLHKRGYRLAGGQAPLKENLAAAILLRAGWKDVIAQGGMLLDPLCGSGTLLLEGAYMAGDIAPGLGRSYFGFIKWKKHQAQLWDELLTLAKNRVNKRNIPKIVGYDHDPDAIKMAFANIERAGLLTHVHVEKRELSALLPFEKQQGLCVTNPPYGERLGEEAELQTLYADLGIKLKKDFGGWRAAVFTGNPELGKTMGIRSYKSYALFNGPIPCQLLLFKIEPEWFVDRSPAADNARRIRQAKKSCTAADLAAVQMFINRLHKNLKKLRREIEQGTTCYRLYDADIPEYAVTVDRYDQYLLVEEYKPPYTVNQEKARLRLMSVLAVLPDTLHISPEMIYFRSKDEAANQVKLPFETKS